MPVPASISAAAVEFHRNSSLLEKVVAGIPAEQWISRPSNHSNPIEWIAGHMLWARQALIARLGMQWQYPGWMYLPAAQKFRKAQRILPRSQCWPRGTTRQTSSAMRLKQ